MSTKQKSFLLTSLVIVALIMLVSRIGQVIINLEESGYIKLKKPQIHALTPATTHIETPVIVDLNNVSDEEMDILEDLNIQKEALEIKGLELQKRELQLQLVAIELKNKMEVLRVAESRIMELVNKHEQQKQEDMSHLVKLYSNMNSKDATRIIENLDIDVAVLLLKAMDTDTAASILAQMSASGAKEITNKLVETTLQRK